MFLSLAICSIISIPAWTPVKEPKKVFIGHTQRWQWCHIIKHTSEPHWVRHALRYLGNTNHTRWVWLSSLLHTWKQWLSEGLIMLLETPVLSAWEIFIVGQGQRMLSQGSMIGKVQNIIITHILQMNKLNLKEVNAHLSHPAKNWGTQ